MEIALREPKRVGQTNYQLCIICQKEKPLPLQKVTSVVSLSTAMTMRQDAIAKRLQPDLNPDIIVEKSPMWHGECRRWYTLKKSYEYAARKHTLATSQPDGHSAMEPEIASKLPTTRSQKFAFDYMTRCIICEKTFTKRKTASFATSESRAKTLLAKAIALGDQDMMNKIQCYPSVAADLVAMDVQYHRPCMNSYINKRCQSQIPVKVCTEKDDAFAMLVDEYKAQLLDNKSVVYLSSIRDRYREILADKGSTNASTYRSALLKKKMQGHFGDLLTFWPQATGSDYVCASSITIADALRKIEQLSSSDNQKTLIQRAAKVIRKDAKRFKEKGQSTLTSNPSINISHSDAEAVIPITLFNFSVSLLSDKDFAEDSDGRLTCDTDISQKALTLSQQLSYAICKSQTPLSVGSAFHVYNVARDKGLITLLNHMNTGVSYDTFQRILTAMCENMIEKEREEGIFFPPAVTGCEFVHFAIDNADWHEKTPDGTTFHALTTNVYGYERTVNTPSDIRSDDCMLVTEDVDLVDSNNELIECQERPSVSSSTLNVASSGHFGYVPDIITSRRSRRSLSSVDAPHITPHYITLGERRKARSLGQLSKGDFLSASDQYLHHMSMAWQLCRCLPTKLLELDIDMSMGWNSFFTKLSPVQCATNIGYGPLIPSSPTDPSVVHKGLEYTAKLARKFGMEHTVVTADQALYEIAYGLRAQAAPNDETYHNMILILGQFHLAANYIGAIGKIMRNSGAEAILAQSGTCKLGTANKIFGPAGDYYQSIRAHKILREAMAMLHLEAFEDWYLAEDRESLDVKELTTSLNTLCANLCDCDDDPDGQQTSDWTLPSNALSNFEAELNKFDEERKDSPTHTLWINYVAQINILLRFTAALRLGLWKQSLTEANNMLPYIVAAGHHNYSYSLPLYLKEMNNLETTAPKIYNYFLNGHFVVRRKDGSFNGVPTDMALEQTYNRDAKQSASGITLDEKARTKWVYTKPILAEASASFKDMMNIPHTTGATQHHDEGKKELVHQIRQCVSELINPFKVKSPDMMNIVTGQTASAVIRSDLENAASIGLAAVQKCMLDESHKIDKVKLHTFEELKAKPSKNLQQKHKEQLQSDVVILKRILHLRSVGKEIDLEETIGQYECSAEPQSLFELDGSMRHGNKATWLNSTLKETKINVNERLPHSDKNTGLIIDSMYFIQEHRFTEGETFADYQSRILRKVISIVPENCDNIHFPGDRYDHGDSRKCGERERRNSMQVHKEYEVIGSIKTPQFKDFMTVSQNKVKLQDFICTSWEAEAQNHMKDGISLFLSGGFVDEHKSVRVSSSGVQPIIELSSNQEECDTRIILHAIYAVHHTNTKRIIIYANDTDITVMCVYYASTILDGIEIWIRKASDQWIPVHQLSKALGPQDCALQPFLYALTGKDDTNFMFGIGKVKAMKHRHDVDCSLLAQYGETNNYDVDDELISASRNLLMVLYGGGNFTSLASLRVHMFMGKTSKDLKCLPPTENAFHQHLMRTLYATLIQKRAHIAVVDLPSVLGFGWRMGANSLEPINMTQSSLPEVAKTITCCKCVGSKCLGNCSCKKSQVPCCLACKCEGKEHKCSRALILQDMSETIDSDASDGDN